MTAGASPRSYRIQPEVVALLKTWRWARVLREPRAAPGSAPDEAAPPSGESSDPAAAPSNASSSAAPAPAPSGLGARLRLPLDKLEAALEKAQTLGLVGAVAEACAASEPKETASVRGDYARGDYAEITRR
jgi:hypothetical protein